MNKETADKGERVSDLHTRSRVAMREQLSSNNTKIRLKTSENSSSKKKPGERKKENISHELQRWQ